MSMRDKIADVIGRNYNIDCGQFMVPLADIADQILAIEVPGETVQLFPCKYITEGILCDAKGNYCPRDGNPSGGGRCTYTHLNTRQATIGDLTGEGKS